MRRQGDDRDGVEPLPERPRDRPAVDQGEVQIEQHQVRLLGIHLIQGVAPVPRHDDLEAATTQAPRQEIREFVVVLDDEKLGHGPS